MQVGCLCSVVGFSCSRDASSHLCPWDDLGRFSASPGGTALPSTGALLLSQPASSAAVSLRGRDHASRLCKVWGPWPPACLLCHKGRTGFVILREVSRQRHPRPRALSCLCSFLRVRARVLCHVALPAGACVQTPLRVPRGPAATAVSAPARPSPPERCALVCAVQASRARPL